MRTLSLLLFLLLPQTLFAGERVIAQAPHVCEMLSAIGAGEDIVGVGSYCDYPEAAAALPKVADHAHLAVEPALKLAPTLLITDSEALSGIGRLRQEGVRLVVSHPQSVAGMIADIRRLGCETGHAERAEVVAAQLELRLQAISGAGNAEFSAFYEVWNSPLITIGGASFLNDVLAHLGIRNIFAGIEQKSPRVSVESVVRAAPQFVLLSGSDAHIEERMQFWRHWLGEDVRFLHVDPDLLNRPGPRLIDGMERLQKRLQKLSRQ